ncbi:MAG TPA: DbpA RNA binding domain-containing protein, partial [Myxococcota bacterium]|nr:DbpA RNA binding domain-containing protein [Myxococcota bacterium]
PAPGGSGVWFRVNIGREEDADPRWLVPLLCKKGGVEKRHIGELRIRDRDTFFEVAPDVAERFDAAAQRPDKRFPGLRFSKAGRQS